MPRFRNYQTNFSGGLLSEGMLGRIDLAQYENGCRQFDNWWPKVSGGARRRPGSVYLQIIADAVRIESFIFSETQTYLVVFHPVSPGTSQLAVSVLDPDDGTVIETLTISNGTTTRAMEMSITQKGDVMFMADGTAAFFMLRRNSATDFQIESFDFEGQPPLGAYPKTMPFIKFEDPEVTISVSGHKKDTVVTVTASQPVFTDRHLSRAIRYRGKQLYVTSVPGPLQPQSTCQAVILEELDQGARLTFNTAVHEPEDFEVGEIVVGRDSGIKAEVLETEANYIIVAMLAGNFPSGATEDIEGLNTGNIAAITSKTSISPPDSADWDEEAFSPTLGYPSTIEFHSQRLWLGGSSSLPAHVFGSRVAAFFNYDVGDAFAADSIQVAISGNQINNVTNIVSGRHLQIFTDHGEFYAPQSEDRPLVPETFDLVKQTSFGSKKNLAKVFDESTLFVQANGNALREFIWRDGIRGYASEAVSLIAEEYINDVQELEVLYGGYDRPEQLAFIVNGDGSIVWYHAARAEGIRSFGRWTTQGSYKSLTVLQDKLYALVERTTDNGNEMFIERFELDVTLDCVKQVSGAASKTWPSVHSALVNQDVRVTTGVTAHDPDYYLGEFALTNGDLTLPIEVDNVTVGLGFKQLLETMPIEVQDSQGVSTGMPKRIVSADLYMASTLAAEIEGNKVLTFLGQNDLTQKPAAITGVRKFYLLGYSERPTLTVENDIPVPFEALALGAEVEY